MLSPALAHLPAPSAAAQALSDALAQHVRAEIAAAGGWISFERFMELALYTPGFGYYSAGSTKLGPSGDFVTAPELSPLFARCLARQVAQVLEAGVPDVVELGAGSGALAVELLRTLSAMDRLPHRYLILEVSADLRKRQRAHLASHAPELLERVQWVEAVPERLHGVVIANEVLDAIPTHVIRTRGAELDEKGVMVNGAGHFEWQHRAASGELLRQSRPIPLPDDYETEINLSARALVKSLSRSLERGVLLLIDYGFAASEYFHPQRSRGTLMCHYRHHAHGDPLVLIGLQDITAHVDFTAIASAGVEAGLELLGYANQAQFLVNTGITDALRETPVDDVRAYAPLAAQAQKLLSPAEMGELFKVMALGTGVEGPLMGFARGDRSHTL